jgi:hypothetical protein
MTILSKFSPTNWREGGFGKGDFHFWIETSWGEIIDPIFPLYREVCRSRGLDINKSKYQEWDNQEHWKKHHHIDKFLKELQKWDEQTIKEFIPQQACCPLNASVKYLENPEHYRIVCGSMGWKKKGRSSVVWYEYG